MLLIFMWLIIEHRRNKEKNKDKAEDEDEKFRVLYMNVMSFMWSKQTNVINLCGVKYELIFQTEDTPGTTKV